jgi:hypothetical protein
VFEGDSRITALEVPTIKEEIGKDELRAKLIEEAPHFMRTLMDTPLPKMPSRLRVPVIETDTKTEAVAARRDALEDFVATHCSYAPGEALTFKEFQEAFVDTLDKHELKEWGKHNIKQSMALKYPIGVWSKNTRYVGNIVLGDPVKETGEIFTLSGTKLIKEKK